MEKLDEADRLLRQFPHGIRAAEFASKLGVQRQSAYDYLNSLDVRGKAWNEHGLWYPKEPPADPGVTKQTVDPVAQAAQRDFDNQLKMYRLALKAADPGTPLIARDVDLRLGKYHVKIEHE